jgi:glutathione S-transferase
MLGKVPFLKTPGGILTESDVILEYLEENHPEPALIPKNTFDAAKVRELNTYLNLHVELSARQLYPEALFNGKVSDELKGQCEKTLKKAIESMVKMTTFSPYIYGETFTIADCSAIFHFPLISRVTKVIYGQDFLEGTPAAEYFEKMKALPPMERILEARKRNAPEMGAWLAKTRESKYSAN